MPRKPTPAPGFLRRLTLSPAFNCDWHIQPDTDVIRDLYLSFLQKIIAWIGYNVKKKACETFVNVESANTQRHVFMI